MLLLGTSWEEVIHYSVWVHLAEKSQIGRNAYGVLKFSVEREYIIFVSIFIAEMREKTNKI